MLNIFDLDTILLLVNGAGVFFLLRKSYEKPYRKPSEKLKSPATKRVNQDIAPSPVNQDIVEGPHVCSFDRMKADGYWRCKCSAKAPDHKQPILKVIAAREKAKEDAKSGTAGSD